MNKIILQDVNYFDKSVNEAIKYNKELYLILMECPLIKSHQWKKKLHNKCKKILTWNDSYVDNKKYYKFFWPQKILEKDLYNVPFNKKKFICMANANKIAIGKGELYSERKKIALYLQKYEPDFDVYGYEWNKTQFKLVPFLHVIKNWRSLTIRQFLYYVDFVFNIRKLLCYKGVVKDIVETYSKYKFNICYENADCYPGYITEKIWNCFNARCVPVYLGASNITEHIPENTFVDRRKFKSDEHLYQYLKAIKEDEYNQYIENINKFLKSKEAQLFSEESFNKRVDEVCN